MKPLPLTVLAVALVSFAPAAEQTITRAQLRDKIEGFWFGQLAGNYIGLPFENLYVDEPIPDLITRVYSVDDDGGLRINRGDRRGYIPIVAEMFDGAFGDDDTDIEFVTLHGVEQYGLDINEAEIAGLWRRHINRMIWVANRTARDLMDQGLLPPQTGSREHNRNWYQIDAQLVNEIWSAFHPGMVNAAVERAEFGARITNDDWGIHPTLAYAAMYSAAFFESDIDRLLDIGFAAVPPHGPFHEGFQDVRRWAAEDKDWRKTRARIHEKYHRYRKDGYEAPVSVVSSLNNGLCGLLALIYGEGDFERTVGIAVSAGYDCDNQAATCGGLIGVIHGSSVIPERITRGLAHPDNPERWWATPFNDRYLNFTRDELPIDNRLSNLVDRTLAIAEQAILAGGGRRIETGGEDAYVVITD